MSDLKEGRTLPTLRCRYKVQVYMSTSLFMKNKVCGIGSSTTREFLFFLDVLSVTEGKGPPWETPVTGSSFPDTRVR